MGGTGTPNTVYRVWEPTPLLRRQIRGQDNRLPGGCTRSSADLVLDHMILILHHEIHPLTLFAKARHGAYAGLASLNAWPAGPRDPAGSS